MALATSLVVLLAIATDAANPTNAPTPPPLPYFGFDAAFGDWMVLQQAPNQAAVYGYVGVGGTSVTVSVLDDSGSTVATVQAKMNATQQPFGSGWGPRPCPKESCPPYDMTPFTPYGVPLNTWKALLPATKAGGNYTIVADCAGCDANISAPSVNISGVAFGDVWYCSGQSNMWLPVGNSFSRNETTDAIRAGKYNNIRVMAGNSGNHPQNSWPSPSYGGQGGSNPWMTAKQAVGTGEEGSNNVLFSFGAACWYFGQRLAERGVDVPIGLADTAIGGQRIEEYMNNATINKCSDRAGEDIPWWDGQLYAMQVLPFVDMTVKGWVWYQGENNMGATKGSALANVGYSCEQRELIRGWREAWSKTPGTTDPDAPFGVVTLASSGSEGGPNMGAMRLAQTMGYGVLPNEYDPNTFFAQAYDLDDEWGPNNGPCFDTWFCCQRGWRAKYNKTLCAGRENLCQPACDASANTPVKMGGIHPRSKKPVGDRLGDAAFNTVYGGTGPYTGPTLAGCSVDGDGLEIRFNASMMRGDKITVNSTFPPFYQPHVRHAAAVGGTQLWVQTNASRFCMEPQQAVNASGQPIQGQYICPKWAGGDGKTAMGPGEYDGGWIMLNFTKASDSSVRVDLSPLNGSAPTAVRYAWGIISCQDTNDPAFNFTSDPNLWVRYGTIAKCPIMGESGYPANPFQSQIVQGKCSCVAPQNCDG